MPNYVLSLLVKPKLKNLLSILRYRLPRFRGKGQNQRVVTFGCLAMLFELSAMLFILVSSPGFRLRSSAFPCYLLGLCSIVKENVDNTSNQHATWPSGFLKFVSQRKDP